MFDDVKIPLRLSAAVGATIAIFATFLPWYSFGVVFGTREVVHVVAVTTTLWGLTTIAPILIVVGAAVALIFTAVLDGRITGLVVTVAGLGITAYAIVKLVEIPELGVRGPNGVRAVTELEGGPFLALVGGLMLLIGGVGEVIASSASPSDTRSSASRTRWQGPSTRPPHAVG
jgi:hypothetical protein